LELFAVCQLIYSQALSLRTMRLPVEQALPPVFSKMKNLSLL
jgi:hypothetical protein